jgi:hypothetical protein
MMPTKDIYYNSCKFNTESLQQAPQNSVKNFQIYLGYTTFPGWGLVIHLEANEFLNSFPS